MSRIFLILGIGLMALSASIVGLDPVRASAIDVDCISNSDGTVSCKRLNDGEWFDCARSVGGTRTCKSRNVVQGADAPITCIDNGANVFSCSNSVSKNKQSDGMSLSTGSVF